jgi:ABC-type glycerol-3-phosphate transport system substrate-binding protein
MKLYKFIAVLVCLVLFVAACAPKATPTPTEVMTEEPTEEPTLPPTATLPPEPVELRFTYYADGVEADVITPIIDAFMAQYPYITVVLDVVPYQTIDEQLPVQVEPVKVPIWPASPTLALSRANYWTCAP